MAPKKRPRRPSDGRPSSSSLCLSSFFTTMNSNCNLHSAFNSAFNSTLNFRLWTFNYRKHQFPQIFRLPISNAINVPQLFLRLRLRPRDLPERRVVEDDVRRDAGAARGFSAAAGGLLDELASG